MGHHNTTHEKGKTLHQFEMVAITQEQTILNYFHRNPASKLSPSKVRRLAFDQSRPPEITSVRRAMSNLTKQGSLTKTDLKAEGPHGRPEYCWALKEKARHPYRESWKNN